VSGCMVRPRSPLAERTWSMDSRTEDVLNAAWQLVSAARRARGVMILCDGHRKLCSTRSRYLDELPEDLVMLDTALQRACDALLAFEGEEEGRQP
jgi:hypothetical protein